MNTLVKQKTESFFQRITQSPISRLLLIGMVLLLLQIPLSMISSQIYERGAQKDHAVQDVTGRWGMQQAILGPIVVIPYYEYINERDKDGKLIRQRYKRHAGFLPDQLNIDSSVKHETRQRGLFAIPLYQTTIAINGSFNRPDFRHWSIAEQDILWQESELVLLVKDAHAIQERAQLTWDGTKQFFNPSAGSVIEKQQGYHINLAGNVKAATTPFSIQLKLNGSQQLAFAPVGNDSVIRLQSDWLDPSFNGKWLPTTRQVTNQGFNSEWRISSISRGYGQQWLFQQSDLLPQLQQSLVGVDFLVAVDNYRMSERSIKYDALFLLLTFLLVWIMEVISKQRVHVVQYLLLGSSLSMFYLLLVALAEHLGFYLAYLLASLAIIVTVALYSKAILKTRGRALIMGVVISALYAYLFSLLNEQNYAFLIGAIGLFAALVITMYLTRNIDWYNNNKTQG